MVKIHSLVFSAFFQKRRLKHDDDTSVKTDVSSSYTQPDTIRYGPFKKKRMEFLISQERYNMGKLGGYSSWKTIRFPKT